MARRRSYGSSRSYGWNRYSYYTKSTPIQVNDDEGIRLKAKRGDIGEHWWSQRWIAVLESFHIGERLNRGKSYARSGQVLSIDIKTGVIQARVQGSQSTPYRVTIKLTPLIEKERAQVAAEMAAKAIYSTKLLCGEMPSNIEDAFRDVKISLFPTKYHDLDTDCSCPDSSNPCKHIAAVYYLLAERFDENPFLIFELRGMAKDALLALIRKTRIISKEEINACETPPSKINGQGKRNSPPNLPINSSISPAEQIAHYWDASKLSLSVNIQPPIVENALLKRLGPSPFEINGTNLTEILSDFYTRQRQSAIQQYLQDHKVQE